MIMLGGTTKEWIAFHCIKFIPHALFSLADLSSYLSEKLWWFHLPMNSQYNCYIIHIDNCVLVGRHPRHTWCPSVCLSFNVTIFHDNSKLNAESCNAGIHVARYSKVNRLLHFVCIGFTRLVAWFVIAHLDANCQLKSSEDHPCLLFNMIFQSVSWTKRQA